MGRRRRARSRGIYRAEVSRKRFYAREAVQLPAANALLMPGLMALLLVFLIWKPVFISLSSKGSGAQYAPLYLSLLAGLGVGALAQRTGFCITGGFARLFMSDREKKLSFPSLQVTRSASAHFFCSRLLQVFLREVSHPAGMGNPVRMKAMSGIFSVWLCRFGSTLIKGCPFRQLISAGQGTLTRGGGPRHADRSGACAKLGLGGNAEGTPYEGKWLSFSVSAPYLSSDFCIEKRRDFAPEFQAGLD